MQVKFIVSQNWQELETDVNAFLATLGGDPTDVKYDLDKCTAVVEYTQVKSGLCCDCRFWDDDGDNLIGLCQRCGGRKRFSDKSCNKFEDVRGR